MFELHTPRLVLRDFVEDDWAAIYAMSQSPAVTRYQSWLRIEDEAAAREWVREAMYHNALVPRQAYNLAVVLAASGATIGWFGYGRPSDAARGDFNFGYALLPSEWGRGFMTEVLVAALDYMVDAQGAKLVTAECANSNIGSARVMEKAGMRLVERWDELDDYTGKMEAYRRYALRVGQEAS